MATRISSFVHRISTGPATLAGLLLFLYFLIGVLPAQSTRMGDASGAIGSPDTSFLYSTEDLYRMAETYGEAGRSAYVRARFTFDLIWPLVYLFFLATSTSWSLARALPEGHRWRTLNLFPFPGWLLDMLENLGSSIVMINYPSRTPVIDSLTPVFTTLKWLFVSGSFLILVAAFVAAVWKGTRSRG